MKQFLTFIGILLIMIGIFGISYTYNVDHRSADHLSAYCTIDFQSSYNEDGNLEGAVLTLWDYRYDSAKLEKKAVLYADGQAYEMVAITKQTEPDENSEQPFKHENKLFAELPRASFSAIRKADEVRLRFYYDNGQTIDLPLNAPDLEYWKKQLIP